MTPHKFKSIKSSQRLSLTRNVKMRWASMPNPETPRDRTTHQDEYEGRDDEGDGDDSVEEGEVGRDVGEVVGEDDAPDEDEGEAPRHHQAEAQREHRGAHHVGCKANE